MNKKTIDTLLVWLRIICTLTVLGLMVYVVLSPTLVYAPAPKVILFFLAASFLAIITGAEATAKFELKLPGFVAVTTGTAAICLTTLLTLVHFAKPEQQIAVYNVIDENNRPVNLNWDGAIALSPSQTGLVANLFVKGNTLILIFPEQLGEQEVSIKKTSDGKPYVGILSYAGSRSTRRKLGEDLK